MTGLPCTVSPSIAVKLSDGARGGRPGDNPTAALVLCTAELHANLSPRRSAAAPR